MRRVVEQLSQVGDLMRWIAAEKEAEAKSFPPTKLFYRWERGKGIEVLIMTLFYDSLRVVTRKKGRSCGRIELQPPVTHLYVI